MSNSTMTLGQYARARVADTLRSWLSLWPTSEFPHVFGGGGPTAAGVPVDEYSILNYSPVYACTTIISGDVGSLPLGLSKVAKNGSKEPYTDHALYELVHDRPNPEMSSMVWRETNQGHALLWGNGYAEIERDGLDRPKAIWPITPDRVTPFREKDSRGRSGPLQYRVRNAVGGGQTVPPTVLPARNMLHIPGMGFDGTIGYSIVRLAHESMALGIAAERFGSTFFGNGSSFGGVLSFKRERMDPEFKQGIRESIGAMHTGVDRAHKFLLLGNEAKYERLGIPPNDAQFLETRRFQIAEVARWFGGIPLHKLGDLERATFANIEQQDIEYYKSCLRRWLVRWEQELNYKLISPLERRYQRIEFNVDGLLRGDSAARAAHYSTMFNIGAYSINMILEKENMNKIGPEGDVHYVPANLTPADRLDEIIDANLKAKTLPPPLPTVKELPPAKDDKKDDDDTRDLLTAIASKTAAIEASLVAQRDALSQAELEQHQHAVQRLKDERDQLQRLFDEYREQQPAEAARWQAALDVARQETSEARTAREAAEAEAEARATAASAARDAELAAAQARVMEAETRAAEIAAMAQAATTARAAALEAAREALEACELASAEAATARAAAEQTAAQQAEAAAALIAQRQAEAERLTGMVAAHRALIVDALQRVLAPELDRARKHQATPEKLRSWAAAFYVTHEDRCLDILRPVIRAHVAWKQSAEDVDAVTVALVREHITESQRQLRAIVDGEPDEMHANLERMLTRWEHDRPHALADRILKDEVDHVRSLR